MKSKLFTKNFTFLILGQAVSMFGTNILKFSVSLYILDLTGSAALFATAIFVVVVGFTGKRSYRLLENVKTE